jgi:hypothetical protein
MSDYMKELLADQGLQQLIRELSDMQYGQSDIQPISVKKHKGRVSQVAIAKAYSYKMEGWSTLIAYMIERGKQFKAYAEANPEEQAKHKMTITVEINSRGECERIEEHDYKMINFRTPS